MHGNTSGPDGMAFGLEPAGRIDRQFPVLLGPALFDRLRALTTGRKAHRLVFHEFGDGEAIMGFDEAEIVERQAPAL